jgi:carboxymethylenebutenolidase
MTALRSMFRMLQFFLIHSLLLLLVLSCQLPSLFGLLLPLPLWTSSVVHVLEHLAAPLPLQATPLEDLANTHIPGPLPDIEILSYVATPNNNKNPKDSNTPLPVLLLIDEFFGLSPSIVEKAQALADDLGCIVVAPDTFWGAVTDFIPKAIWLALTTPTEHVNDDPSSWRQILVVASQG